MSFIIDDDCCSSGDDCCDIFVVKGETDVDDSGEGVDVIVVLISVVIPDFVFGDNLYTKSSNTVGGEFFLLLFFILDNESSSSSDNSLISFDLPTDKVRKTLEISLSLSLQHISSFLFLFFGFSFLFISFISSY